MKECKDIRKNWIRNKKLIDLNEVPKELKKEIINMYIGETKNIEPFKFNDVSKYFRMYDLEELNLKINER